jgi:hypothetical protein
VVVVTLDVERTPRPDGDPEPDRVPRLNRTRSREAMKRSQASGAKLPDPGTACEANVPYPS